MNANELIKENQLRNNFEMMQGKMDLKSTPPYVTIGAHYKCNAHCTFCLGGEFPKFNLDIYKKLFESKLSNVLRNAVNVGFCGMGEILLLPEIEDFIDYVNDTIPSASKVFTTNGIALNSRLCDKLSEGNYALLISLHAANNMLHRKLTGTYMYDEIIENIKYLSSLKSKYSQLHLNLIFLMTTLNIENLPEYVRLGKTLGADRITCSYLTIFEPEQVKLSCYFMKERTEEIIKEAVDIAQRIGIELILPPRFNQPAGEKDKNHFCQDPWGFFYVETQGSVNPCCYAGNHIGYLNKSDFESIWNGNGYKRLRKGIVSGSVYSWCKYCCKFDPDNINDIRSHITFRPETQQKILNYLREHKNEYDVSEKELQI